MDEANFLYNNAARFFYFTWTEDMTIEDLVIGFHSRLGKISKPNTNEDLKGHLLLREASLGSHDCNMIIGPAGSDYSLQSLAGGLSNAYRMERRIFL